MECVLYMMPVALVYAITNNLERAMAIMFIVIVVKFIQTAYCINVSKKEPSNSLKYAKCYHASFYSS